MDAADVLRAESRAKRVLVVDDDPVVGRIVVRILRGMGFDANAIEDPIEGLRIAERGGADLVLADLGMPGLDGAELCRLLKGRPQTRALPVIVCSGRSVKEQRMLAPDATAFLEKPFTPANLLRSIDSVLHADPVHSAPLANE